MSINLRSWSSCWILIFSALISTDASKEIVCPYPADSSQCSGSPLIGFTGLQHMITYKRSMVRIPCSFSCCGNVTLSLLINGKPFNRQISSFSHTERYSILGGKNMLISETAFNFRAKFDSDQGYYKCVISQGPYKKYTSNQGVLFRDFSFARLQYTISDIRYKPEFANRSSASYQAVEKLISKEVGKRLTAFSLNTRRVIAVYHISSHSVGIRASMVVLQHASNTIHREKFCKVAYNNLGGTFTSFTLQSSTSSVIDCCRQTTTGSANNRGVFLWDYTTIVSSYAKTVRVKCPYNLASDVKYATRKCNSGFDRGAYWRTVSDRSCLKRDDMNSDMRFLSKIEVTSQSVLLVSENLVSLSQTSMNATNSSVIPSSVSVMEKILRSSEANNEVLDNVLTSVNHLLDIDQSTVVVAQEKHNTSNRLLSVLDELGRQYNVTEMDTGVNLTKKNLVLIAARADLAIETGVQFTLICPSKLTLQSSKLIYTREKALNAAIQLADETAYIPYSMINQASALSNSSDAKVYGYLFRDSKLFMTRGSLQWSWNVSRVLSVSIMDTIVRNSTDQINLSWKIHGVQNKKLCSFWDVRENGSWSQVGCSLKDTKDDVTICQCDHLTSFALLFMHDDSSVPKIHKMVLSIITYVGCGFSLTGLFLTIIVLMFFSKIRKLLPPKILLGLCISLSSTIFVFLLGVESSKNRTRCGVVAAVLHYAMLSTFLWNAVEGINLYLCFVVVYNNYVDKFMTKACLFSLGLPLLIVTTTALCRFHEDYGAGDFCIVTGRSFYVSLLAPIIIIMTMNIFILVRVMHSINKSSSVNSSPNNLHKGRIWFSCACLMGLTWVFGVLSVAESHVVFQYIFCITASFQGFFLFVFHGLMNKSVKSEIVKVMTVYIPESFRRRLSNTVECQSQVKPRLGNPIAKHTSLRPVKYSASSPKLSRIDT